MVISQVNQNVYNGDGINKAWPYTFEIIDKTDVHLILQDVDGTQTVLTSDYYIDEINATAYYPGYAPGAEPPEADQPPKVQEGQKIVVYRKIPVNQLAKLGDKWPFAVIEKGLDKLTMLIQDVWGWFDENVIQRVGDSWNAMGFPIHNVGGPVNVDDAATKDYVDRILSGFILEGDSRLVPFDTVSQMVDADLEAGQIAYTLGYGDINDGGSAVYAIRTKELSDKNDGIYTIFLNNDNVATLISYRDNADRMGFLIHDELDMQRTPFAVFITETGDVPAGYNGTQGMCVAGDYLIVSRHQDDAYNSRVYVLDIINKAVLSHTDMSINHGNNFTYANGYVYCGIRGIDDEDASLIYKSKLTGDTLENPTTITVPGKYTAIAYCETDGLFYLRSSGGKTIYTTSDFINIEELFTLDFDLDAAVTTQNQGLCVDKRFIYYPVTCGDDVERLFVVDKYTGESVKVYHFPRFAYGEIEDVDTYNGQLFINFNRSGYPSYVYCVPLYVNAPSVEDKVKGHAGGNYNATRYNMYVNNDNPVAFPDGTNTRPFNSIEAALNVCDYLNLNAALYVEGTYENVNIMYHSKRVYINFVGATITNQIHITASNVFITGTYTAKQIYAAGGSVVNLSGGTLDGDNTSDPAIYCSSSTVVGTLSKIQKYSSSTIENTTGFVDVDVDTLTNATTDTKGSADINNTSIHSHNNPYSGPAIVEKYTGITTGVSPASHSPGYVLGMVDKNGASLGGVYKRVNNNGGSRTGLLDVWNSNSAGLYSENLADASLAVRPSADNAIMLGTSSYRWAEVYAGTGSINTSDERLKDNIESIPDDVLDAWGEVGWYQFQFKDAIAEKGESARIHTGTIAQRIKEVFEAHDLDAFRYGLLCYDEWDAETEDADDKGNVVQEAREAGNLYSLRYEEALCMEAAYQRRRADRLEARIEALEESINHED